MKGQQTLRMEHGAIVIMPPWFQGEVGWGNLALPNVYADGQDQQYPAGTKFIEGERVFYYAKYLGKITLTSWNSALQTPDATNCDNQMGRFLLQHCYQKEMADGLLVRHTKGEESMWFKTTESEAQAKDYYSGGWVSGRDTGAGYRGFYRRIVAHNYDASKVIPGQSSADSNVSELELDQAIEISKTTLPTTIMPCQWKHIIYKQHDESKQFAPFLGAVMANVVAPNKWIWLLTWGPMILSHAYTEKAGALKSETMYKISGDGSINPQHSVSPTPTQASTFQVAGVSMVSTIMETGSGVDVEDPMVYVMLRR